MLLASFLTFAFIGTGVCKDFFTYFVLSQSSHPISINWGIIRVKEDKYKVFAEYEYIDRGELFKGKTIFKKAMLNDLAAKSFQEELMQEKGLVFHSIDNKKSSLERGVPVAALLRAAISLFLFLYFLFLGVYLQRFSCK